MRRRILVSLLFVLFSCGTVHAQRFTDRSALFQLSDQSKQELKTRRTQLYYDLLRSTNPAVQALNRDPRIQLMYIDDWGMPVYYVAHNLNAAKTIGTDRVWPGGDSGHNLSGWDTIVGQLALWDTGKVLAEHQEFNGRVLQIDKPAKISSHGTKVAGTMIASGVDANAKGMSYEAFLHAYDWDNDEAEMAKAAANGLLVSNHSYSRVAGWDYCREKEAWYWHGDMYISNLEDYLFGFYSPHARAWDMISYRAPYYLIVESASNDRAEKGPKDGTGHYHWEGEWAWSTDRHNADGAPDGFGCVPPEATAKNILTVGAIKDIAEGYTEARDVVQTYFSSWGPTDDGRIKPDVVANGDSLHTTSSDGIAVYDTVSGTSFSSPNVAGSVNLLVSHYKAIHGVFARSATMKAILIFSSDEAGEYAGPDYMNGWGLVNIASAANAIAGGASIIEGELNNGHVRFYEFTVDSVTDIRTTIVWTDIPGPVLGRALNQPTPILINDIDIRVQHLSSGVLYEPWILNVKDPSAAAQKGDNSADNLEQIDIADAPAGTYRVTVSHKRSLTTGQQAFSLVCSRNIVNYLVVDYYSRWIQNTVELNWTMADSASKYVFQISRCTLPGDVFVDLPSEVIGEGYEVSFRDDSAQLGTTYEYRVSVLSSQSITADFTTTIITPPKVFSLSQNYPNPFRPETQIDFSLDRGGPLSLKIYDVSGHLVRVLVDRYLEAGKYSEIWNGLDAQGSRAASGVYFYRLAAQNRTLVRKMILLR